PADRRVGEYLVSVYDALVSHVSEQLHGVLGPDTSNSASAALPFSYNLLMTKDMMAVIPRSKLYDPSKPKSPKMNPFAYVGSMGTTCDEEAGWVKEYGFLALLELYASPLDKAQPSTPAVAATQLTNGGLTNGGLPNGGLPNGGLTNGRLP